MTILLFALGWFVVGALTTSILCLMLGANRDDDDDDDEAVVETVVEEGP